MPEVPEQSFLGRFGFGGYIEDDADLKAGYLIQWKDTGECIKHFASTISTACRTQMVETGCSYEEAAAAFLMKCDEALAARYMLDLNSEDEKQSKKKK